MIADNDAFHFTSHDVLKINQTFFGKEDTGLWQIIDPTRVDEEEKRVHDMTYVGDKEPCIFGDRETRRIWLIDRNLNITCLGPTLHFLPHLNITTLEK